MRGLIGLSAVVLTVGGCASRPASDPAVSGTRNQVDGSSASLPASVTPTNVDEAPTLPVGTPGTPSGLPDDRTPLAEPKGPIDPRSAEGAGQVVQLYMALIGEGKVDEAQKAWGPGIDQGALAPARLKALTEVHGEVGKPHDQEGAAGSSFIQVPTRVYGKDEAGKPFNLIGELTLRRVNDVDGSTAQQRRWHIVKSALVSRM